MREKHDWSPSFSTRLKIPAGTGDCTCLYRGSHMPVCRLGMNPQPRHVPWQGIEPASFQVSGNAPTTELLGPRQILFIYFYREGKGRRKRGDCSTHPSLGPAATQAPVLTGNGVQWPSALCEDTYSTEPRQPGPLLVHFLQGCQSDCPTVQIQSYHLSH